MANIGEALKMDLDALRSAKVFTPPYVYSMRHGLETRKMIEAANRATMAGIFERRKRERQTLEWNRKIKRMHDSGIHMPGHCPYCPANIYYD